MKCSLLSPDDQIVHHNQFAAIPSGQSDSAKGSVRWNKEFIVHPDDIKQGLQAGEAFYITKVGKFWQDKVRVKFG